MKLGNVLSTVACCLVLIAVGIGCLHLFRLYHRNARNSLPAETPVIQIEEDSDDFSIVWEIDINDVTVQDSNLVFDFYSPPSYAVTFDTNSDPLTLGKVMIRWLQDNPVYGSQLTFNVPLEDKAEYDAIMEGNNKKDKEVKVPDVNNTTAKILVSKVIYRETNGIPVCPYCQKPTERTGGTGMATCMYFAPVYDENGVNTNPDRNIYTSTYNCLECGNFYTISGNAYDGYTYH